MYKFTNGIVVFDEKTRDDYIKAGYQLVKKTKKKTKDIINDKGNIDGESIDKLNKQPKKSTRKT